jgi:hypothetical protein
MGLDMWLPSVFNFDDEAAVDALFGRLPKVDTSTAEGIHAYFNQTYGAMEATGGYYREGYNRNGLLSLLNIDVLSYVDRVGEWTLPVDRAAFLLAELKAQPVTVAMLERRLAGDDTCVHPVVKFLEASLEAAFETPHELPLSPTEVEANAAEWLPHLDRKRNVLMSLLSKSIQRNEPLHISG